jgi:putative membrane protein
MRYLKFAFLGVLGLVLLTLALANRGAVTLRLLPEEMGSYLGVDWAVDLPLFIVVFGGIVAGLLIGFVWEWFREHKHRAAGAQARREAAKLEREVTKLRDTRASPEDEILALLEKPRKAG